MAKLTRKTAQVFGSTAGFQQLAQFGSLAAASPTYSTDPAVIQSLSNWLEGWFGAVLGGNSPAIEDMNAFCYVMAYQVAYLMQTGVEEWDSGTTYYIGSVANDGTGNLYVSLTNTNLNNVLTSTANWRPLLMNVVSINPATQSPYALALTDIGKTFLVNSANGAMVFNLPTTQSANFNFSIVDSGGVSQTSGITINQHASEKISGQNSYLLNFNYGFVSLVCDGSNYFIENEKNGLKARRWTGYQTGGAWTSNTAGFVDGTNSGGNAITTRISNGLTCTAASGTQNGITFTPRTAQSVYKITASSCVASAGAGGVTGLQLTDGTTVIAQASQQSGGTGTWYFPFTISGDYAPGTTSAVTVKLQLNNVSGSSSAIAGVSGTSVEWTVEEIF